LSGPSTTDLHGAAGRRDAAQDHHPRGAGDRVGFQWYARIGLAAILLLFVTVTFNDLKRLVTGWFGAGD